ncbi:Copper transport protein CTR2 [Zalerion maritima]|uniref:Copper transport protein n=1 Tax=Zalerion maritima TaxID=339359 RepID=A0AAD5RYT3_9PEZI|nr:Copper transport protein CTR2 [Zalerion maritima]
MLFTWDATNLCLVSPRWRIRGSLSLLVSLAAVAGLAAGYEALRAATRRYEKGTERRLGDLPKRSQQRKRAKIVKAVLYAAQNFYAFMIMLLFMTYNGWVMVAVTAGFFAGYMLFADDDESSATKDTACH